MKLVIDIQEEQYEWIKNLTHGITDYRTTEKLYESVRNGIPLPKGHGDLIDRAELMKHEVWGTFGETGYDAPCVFRAYITGAPVIIPAEQEGEKDDAE